MTNQKIIDNFYIDRIYIYSNRGLYYKLHQIEEEFYWIDLEISGGFLYDKNGIIKGTSKQMLELVKDNLLCFDYFEDFIIYTFNQLTKIK